MEKYATRRWRICPSPDRDLREPADGFHLLPSFRHYVSPSTLFVEWSTASYASA